MPWDPGVLLPQIEAEYTDKEWAAEGEALRRFFEKFANSYKTDLSEPKFLGKGGGGLAVRFERGDDRVGVVLKVARPIPTGTVDLDEVLEREARMIGRIRHPNVVRLVDRDSLTIDNRRFSYYTTELLNEPMDSDRYLLHRTATDGDYLVGDDELDDALATIALDALSGLTAIHSLRILHSDIKPQNIFVERNGRASLGDFGFALDLSKINSTSSELLVGGTNGYMHPDLANTVKQYSDERRVHATVTKRSANLSWDLYSLGLTFIELLKIADDRTPRLANSSTRRYLRLIAARLLDGHNDSLASRPLGLPRNAFKELKYSSAEEALQDIQRQTGQYRLTQRVPELSLEQPEIIQASSLGTPPFTARTRALFDAPEVRQLAHVSQLGMLKLVYPTATHSRREHSLGTYAACIRYIRALEADGLSPLFRSIMSEVDICAVLVVSLVHDIGHYSLAHDLEEGEHGVFSHEERSKYLLRNPSEQLRRAIEDPAPAGWGVSIERVIQLLDAKPMYSGSIRDQILHSIIDGPIDCDKVDYLIRDSENLRLPYGAGIDHSKLISALSVYVNSEEVRPGAQIIIADRGRIAAESVAFARYALYGAAYWHHAHRSAKAMLNRLVWLRVIKETSNVRTYRSSLRQSLYSLLDGSRDLQKPLFVDRLGITSDFEAAILDPGSERLIRWLVADDDEKALNLANMLMNRHLYKRGFVFTKAGNEGIEFGDLERIFSLKGDWRDKLMLSERVEAGILDLVRNREKEAREHSYIGSVGFTSLVGHDPADIICLVDYPPAKSGSRGALTSLPERQDAEYEEPVRSRLWQLLSDSPGAGSAKLRVLLHPEYESWVTNLLTRQDMVKILNTALSESD